MIEERAASKMLFQNKIIVVFRGEEITGVGKW